MNTLHHEFRARSWAVLVSCIALVTALIPGRAQAISILVNYDYDSNNFFFNQQVRKDALQAAADRYSAVITETLLAASLTNGTVDPRIGFTHPSTGLQFEVSPATSTANDAIAAAGGGAANEYRGSWSIPANQYIIYVGGRSLSGSTAGEANTGSGTNFETVFQSGTSHLNRGFRSSGDSDSGYLPMWGGAIAFDNDGSTTWHYNHTTAAPTGSVDFYSIALHEIGHLLGLGANWYEWASHSPSGSGLFQGSNTVSTYNADNGTSLSSLELVEAPDPPSDPGDFHFKDNTYDSYIFQNGSPNLVGTVGTGVKQDLLMEPIANFSPSARRFELTNVDVAGLRDVGWSTLAQIGNTQPGDYNKNGMVNAADYVVFRKGLADGNYATWRANFGESISGASPANSPHSHAVPEPTPGLICLFAMYQMFTSRRPPRRW